MSIAILLINPDVILKGNLSDISNLILNLFGAIESVENTESNDLISSRWKDEYCRKV